MKQAPRTEATPLADFLLRTRSGHCEYYATATVLLLRAAGIPARYAHANAVHNPNARLQFPISPETYQKAAMISTPINLMDASPIGDGAAAVLLAPVDKLPRGLAAPTITVMRIWIGYFFDRGA